MNCIIHRDDELMHFGVRGQKWGVRRYQNEDGSYKSGAEGRYDPDGKPGVNSGHTLKNRIKSAAGIYKDGDGNPYVSEKRRKNRKLEGEMTEKPKTKEKKPNPDDDDKWTQEDLDKYFGKGYFDGPVTKFKNSRQESSSKKAEKQKKTDEKAAKDSYKKAALRYIGRNVAIGAAGKLVGNGVGALSKNPLAGLYANAAVNTAGGLYNIAKTGKEVHDIHSYRKRKNAQHSGFTEYDALYHSASGQTYGIHRTK